MKKRRTLCYYTFFASNLNLKSELKNSDFQNLTLLCSFRAFRARLLSDFLLLGHFYPRIRLCRPEIGLISLCNYQKVDFDTFLNLFTKLGVSWPTQPVTTVPFKTLCTGRSMCSFRYALSRFEARGRGGPPRGGRGGFRSRSRSTERSGERSGGYQRGGGRSFE